MYTLDERLGGPQSRSERCEEKYCPYATYIADIDLIFTIEPFSREVLSRDAVLTLCRFLQCEFVPLPSSILITAAVWL